MTPSSSDALNPRELSSSAATVARSHDVVTASTKALHGVELNDADQAALRWAESLLSRAAKTEVVFPAGSVPELAGSGEALAMLRLATSRTPDGADPMDQVRDGLRRLIEVRHVEDNTREPLEALRRIFAMASELGLRARIRAHQANDTIGSWGASKTSLAS